jgi:uncharacterized protein
MRIQATKGGKCRTRGSDVLIFLLSGGYIHKSVSDNYRKESLPMSSVIGEAEVREQLMANNEEFRRLATEHQAYSQQLDQLSGRAHLSEEERIQEIRLKKKKLLLKDQMYSIVQKYRKELMEQA